MPCTAAHHSSPHTRSALGSSPRASSPHREIFPARQAAKESRPAPHAQTASPTKQASATHPLALPAANLVALPSRGQMRAHKNPTPQRDACSAAADRPPRVVSQPAHANDQEEPRRPDSAAAPRPKAGSKLRQTLTDQPGTRPTAGGMAVPQLPPQQGLLKEQY